MLQISAAVTDAFLAESEAAYIEDWRNYFAAPRWQPMRDRLTPESIAAAAGTAHRLLAAEPDLQGSFVLVQLFHDRLGMTLADVIAETREEPVTVLLLLRRMPGDVMVLLQGGR